MPGTELIFLLVFGAGAAAAGFALRLLGRNDRLRVWRDAAARGGLMDVQHHQALLEPNYLSGFSGLLYVRLEHYQRGENEDGTRIRLGGLERGPTALTLRPEDPSNLGDVVKKRLLGASEVEIGDEDFDAAFFIGGATSVVLARLEAHVRRRLLILARSFRVEVVDGELHVDVPHSHRIRIEHVLPLALRTALDIAHRLMQQLDLLPALVKNADEDPNPAVRLQNVLALGREFAGQPEARAALQRACQDPSAQVRLRAAMALGRAGRETLLALTRSDAEDSCVARAVLVLREELAPERVQEVLSRALRGRCFETADACIRILGWRGGADVVPTLAKVMRIEGANDLGVAAATALGVTKNPAAEEALIIALRHASPDLRLAAAAALANVGTAAAVLPLQEAGNRVADVRFSRAVRQAVAQIQARLGGASPGQLSLSSADAGALSIADREAGQISLPAGEAGQVSLPDAERGRVSLERPPHKG